MPTITAQDRPVPVANESDFRAPKKTIQATTGTDGFKPPLQSPGQINTTEEKPKEVTLSPQLTALARKEAKFRQQEQEFKAAKAQFDAEKLEFGKLPELKTKLAAKDYSILDELGVSYEEWTQYLINKGAESDPAQQKIKSLEDKVNSFEEQQKTNVTKQYEATVKQYERDIKNLVDSNPEFDSIKSRKAEGHVLQHILDTFNEDGEILTVEQAAKEIEDAIVEEALEMASLSKVKAKQTPEVPAKTLPMPKSGLRTLTNQVTQTIPSAPRNQFQHLSPKERIAQAVAKATRQT